MQKHAPDPLLFGSLLNAVIPFNYGLFIYHFSCVDVEHEAWLSGELGSAGEMVGLKGLRGLYNINDSMVLFFYCYYLFYHDKSNSQV